jgi:type IV secretory pathway VirB10-like protein
MPSTPSNQRATGAARPPGVLPRNAHFIIIIGIVLLIIIASLTSGSKKKNVPDAKTPVGPSANQLKSFRDTLEKQRQELELSNKQRGEREPQKQLLEPPLRAETQSRGGEAPDQSRERARAAASLFASNIVIRAAGKEADAQIDTAEQIVFRAEILEGKAAAAAAEVSGPQESGRHLPEREGHLFRLFEGTTIQTRLQNRLDGSFTGPVICLVSKAVKSKDEKVVLIPLNSRFIGTASRVDAQNQTRLAVTFKRLIMPSGYSVDLEAAPGLDQIGETGLKGKVNNHRLRTFGISGAIGLLGGLSLYRSRANLFAAGVANATGNSATSALAHYLNAVPTITIREGHQVVVYLPNDLLLPQYLPNPRKDQ